MSFTQFYQLAKVDAAKHEVWGIAAIEEPDQSGEIMDYEKSKPHFIAWSQRVRNASGGKSQGNVRDSHTTKAVGKVIHLAFDDLAKAVRVGVRVLDAEAWRKVVEGVFTGFSIGGSYGAKWPDDLRKTLTRYEAIPNEISLVDLPCIPGATFELVKQERGYLFKGENLMEDQQEEREEQTEEAALPAEEGDTPREETDSSAAESDSESESEGQTLGAEEIKSIVIDVLAELGLVQPVSGGPMQMGAKLGDMVKSQTQSLAARVDKLQNQVINAEKGLLKMQTVDLGELRKSFEGFKTALLADLAKVAVVVDALEKRGGPGPVIRDLGAISPQAMAEMQKASVLKDLLKDAADPQTRQMLQNEITRLEIKAVQTSK